MRKSQHNLPPKILHVCKVFLPVQGGVQKVVNLLASLLENYSHDVLTSGEDGAIPEQKTAEINISRCRSYGQIASMPLAPSLLPRFVRRFRRYQLIAVHYPFPLVDLGLLFCLARVPVVVHWHSNIVAQKKLRWLVAPFTYCMLLRARAIVVTSEKMVENSFFLRHFRRKVQMIPYGLSSVTPAQQPAPSKSDYFVIIGRHVSYKGIDVAIRSLQYSNEQLKIVGDGPLFERHVQLVDELGLAERVEFDRHADDHQLIETLQNSIALVVSSNLESEAFALVQLEAMRLGKPIINTNLNSSVPWVARDQQEALTVAPNDSQALAAAMQKLRTDTQLAKQLGERGLQRYEQEFTAQKFCQATDRLYKSLIQEPGT